jgi:hypothetical protein
MLHARLTEAILIVFPFRTQVDNRANPLLLQALNIVKHERTPQAKMLVDHIPPVQPNLAAGYSSGHASALSDISNSPARTGRLR